MSIFWDLDIVFFDKEMPSSNKLFSHMIIKNLRETVDPRCYDTDRGSVRKLENFNRIGGDNLAGYYKFKPTPEVRRTYDIRIVFQLLLSVYDRHERRSKLLIIDPENKISNPSTSTHRLYIWYVGLRNTRTYDQNYYKVNWEDRNG